MVSPWISVSPSTMRELILNPENASGQLMDLLMVHHDTPGALQPAHIPSLSDVRALCEPLAIVMRVLIEKLQEKQSPVTFPWELHFLCDPAPVLPRVRKSLSITAQWLTLQSEFGTNNVKVMHLTRSCSQIQLKAGWGKEKKTGIEMAGIQIKGAERILYSGTTKDWVDMNGPPSMAQEELKKASKVKPMSVLLWNCRGAARKGFRRNLWQLYRDHKPDFVILTETRVNLNSAKYWLEEFPFNSMEVVEPIGFTGGIIILWNEGVNKFEVFCKDDRFLHGSIQVCSSYSFLFTAVYAPTKHSQRIAIWKKIENIATSIALPWLCIGDFNQIANSSEKRGGRIPKENRMRMFNDFMQNCAFIDLGASGNKFTWFNKRRSHPIYERLDRCLANQQWLNLFPDYAVTNLSRMSSDHCPVVLNLKQQNLTNSKKFNFEPGWLKTNEFNQLVVNNWISYPGDLSCKLEKMGKDIAAWAENFNSISKRVKTLRNRIRGIQRAMENEPRNIFLFDLEKKLNADLEFLLDEEEMFWAMRARTEWITSGDRNTSFFQTSAIINRNCNRIKSLSNSVGENFFCQSDFERLFLSHFSSLFSSESQPDPMFHHHVNRFCIDDIPSSSEIWEAVSSIHKSKSPGVDGFHSWFYHHFWEIIKGDCINLLNQFFSLKRVPNTLNKTCIALVPKIRNPTKVTSFRPISLLNTSQKIVSKILVNRLRPILINIISPNQNSFLRGRGTDTNYIIASEILHCMHKKRGKKGFFCS
ncbi:hypothetical protein RDABS01_036994 [Bienertia sinuspersici]